jgi:hypothetical protein
MELQAAGVGKLQLLSTSGLPWAEEAPAISQAGMRRQGN